ncbi:MAG: DUF2341 domain-containing protein, partial [Rhodothermales bacterium]|nr:DUF2341 domain-containing protein [Rhodothermales bacterium]
ITARETVDSDADGQIDHIRIIADQALDDDFSGLSMVVSGYTVNGFVTNIGAGGANDNVFYVQLTESGTPDTGVTPTVGIVSNTTLSDLGGSNNIAADSPAGWWDSNWLDRKQIVFDNTNSTEDLDFFPVLVTLTAAEIDYGSTQNAGEDIRFVDSDGTPLDFEIEKWDESGTSYIWVKVPRIDAGSNTDYIWMYYNNTGASDGQNALGVWSDNYEGVWHLGESGSGAAGEFVDSSGTNHGTGGGGSAAATPTQDSGGVIGDAQLFDGVDDYIEIPTNYLLSDVSLEMWFYYDGVGSADHILAGKSDGGSTESWSIHVNNNVDVRIRDDINNAGRNYYDTAVGPIGWHHIVATMDGLENRLYLDGALVPGGSGQLSDNDWASFVGNFFIGQRGNDSMFWDNLIDEVRLSSIARSAEWIEAQYLNQEGSFSFTNFGSGEALGVVATDKAAPVLISATTPQFDGDNAFQSVGEQVDAGERIGFVGCTGYCTGDHLHFEVHENGRHVDPLGYLRG